MTEYYPIELFHWAGMKDEHINELIKILTACPNFVNETNDFGDNCLFIAAKMGNINMVKYIVENTNIDINHANSDGSALLIALTQGHMEIVNYFLDSTKINIHLKNSHGEGIYHLAAKTGNSNLIEKLLKIDKEKRIGDLNNIGRHCLFNVVDSYAIHKNYWCFELIQENLSDDELLQRDKNGMNILDFTINSQFININGSKIDRTKLYAPLINILRSRGL